MKKDYTYWIVWIIAALVGGFTRGWIVGVALMCAGLVVYLLLVTPINTEIARLNRELADAARRRRLHSALRSWRK